MSTNESNRVTIEVDMHTREGVVKITRHGTFTGEVNEVGLHRVEWDEDGYGRFGWWAAPNPNPFPS